MALPCAPRALAYSSQNSQASTSSSPPPRNTTTPLTPSTNPLGIHSIVETSIIPKDPHPPFPLIAPRIRKIIARNKNILSLSLSPSLSTIAAQPPSPGPKEKPHIKLTAPVLTS
ncbi:hypothetical protein KC19_4G262500 [Ceratodon purpureus]|uniref:Uncharacterized protein n=1 Tax=Ceratodon purpureus TaxID=3225 RepID=A0A8T0IFG9_CERPU|nr:hypothetical protein KC19_4G262500 [Ceratodon purpureus]